MRLAGRAVPAWLEEDVFKTPWVHVHTVTEVRPWSKSEPTLLLGNGDDIRQTHGMTGQHHVTCDVNVARAVAVDYDNANNAVFWTDVKNRNITRSLHLLTGLPYHTQHLHYRPSNMPVHFGTP